MPASRYFCCVAALLVGSACRSREPLSIGDGFPRAAGRPSIMDVVRQAFDSSSPPVTIRSEPWSADPYGSLETVSAQAEHFAATPGLIGVVGHAGSRDALLASVVYNASGVPQIVPNATSRRLSAAGPWTFPLVPHDGIVGAALVSYALDSLRLARMTVMYFGDEYGIGLRDGVEAALQSRGRRLADQVIVPSQGCFTARDSLLTRLIPLASIRRTAPDVVVLAVSSLTAACLAPVIAAARPGVWLLGADGVVASSPEIVGLPLAIRQHFRAVVFWRPGADSANQRFLARARRILGRDPFPAEALTYDGHMLLAAAARATGGGRAAVRRWLEELGRSRPAYQGITGPISFAVPRRDLIHLMVVREDTP